MEVVGRDCGNGLIHWVVRPLAVKSIAAILLAGVQHAPPAIRTVVARRAALPANWRAIAPAAVPVRRTGVLVVAAARSTHLDTEVGVGAAIVSRWAAAAIRAEAVARVARRLTIEEPVEDIARSSGDLRVVVTSKARCWDKGDVLK